MSRCSGLAATWLLLGVLVASGAGAAPSRVLEFGVFYDGRSIGTHEYWIVEDGEVTRVVSRARFDVKLLFVPVYRYRHVANEVWREGCLTALVSATDDNGERYRVTASGQAAALDAPTASASGKRPPAADCHGSFAYWDRERLDRPRLVNAQTGELTGARLVREGEEPYAGHAAVRYRLDAEGLASITLWYALEDAQWLGLATRRDNATLEYRLKTVSRGDASAVQKHARIEDAVGIETALDRL